MTAFTQKVVDNFDNKFPPKKSFKINKITKPVLITLITITVGFLSAIISSILTGVSSTIQISGLQTVFNPLITIAYLLIGYLISYFNALTKKQQYKLFIFSLLLSFTIDFINGAILLIILIPLLKKLKLITSTSPSA